MARLPICTHPAIIYVEETPVAVGEDPFVRLLIVGVSGYCRDFLQEMWVVLT